MVKESLLLCPSTKAMTLSITQLISERNTARASHTAAEKALAAANAELVAARKADRDTPRSDMSASDAALARRLAAELAIKPASDALAAAGSKWNKAQAELTRAMRGN